MLPTDERRSLTGRFRTFAEETRGRSPLYLHLSEAIANDPSLASVLEAASPGQRRANLLFAAVHDVLLAGADHELQRYYPSLGGDAAPDDRTTSAFRAFIEGHRQEVVSRIAQRRTQTNEPGRCAALRPALARLAARTARPVALVELGASAGLLLHLDRYGYRYGGDQLSVGPANAAVEIHCDLRGAPPPDIELPVVTDRVGIDLDPLSPADEDDARWLRACVWPDDLPRLARLDAALTTARDHDDVHLIRGNALTDLPSVVADVHEDTVVCVIHSAALAYLDEEARMTIEQQLDELGAERELARICFEGPFVEPFASMELLQPTTPPEEERFLVGLSFWSDGRRTDELLARSQPHGAWLEWLAR